MLRKKGSQEKKVLLFVRCIAFKYLLPENGNPSTQLGPKKSNLPFLLFCGMVGGWG
jgi:hypothetical protein